MEATIFSSRSKDKIIRLLYQKPQARYHMREIERLTNEHINSVREALLSLTKEAFLVREEVGRKTVFQANKNGLFYDEILRMVAKTSGLGLRIVKERLKLGKIKTAFLTSNFYLHGLHANEEIDLFVVGSISVAELAKLTKEEGEQLGMEINYSVMTDDEFAFRKKNKDPFLTEILSKNRLLLVGKEESLF